MFNGIAFQVLVDCDFAITMQVRMLMLFGSNTEFECQISVFPIDTLERNRIIIFWDVSGNIFLLDLLGCVKFHKPGSGKLAGRRVRSSIHGSDKRLRQIWEKPRGEGRLRNE
jgi:hypothetical protein